MMAMIKQVVQDSLKDLLLASHGRHASELAPSAKRGSEPGIVSDDSDDLASQGSPGEGDNPTFVFSLVSPFVSAVRQALEILEPVQE